MSKSTEFVSNAIDQLKYYVYIYSDPDTKIPFYIGKGKGNRCFNHLFQNGESEKIKKLQELRAEGKDPVIEILVYGVDEETAFKVEAAAIDLIGLENLTNVQRGHHSGTYGRIDVDELNARFSKRILKREDIEENILLIRINQLYHYGMTDLELYDATRSCWVINQERAEHVQYVFAVYEGMVMEVYKITAWLPAHSTMNTRFLSDEIRNKDIDSKRKEFVGVIAPSEIRDKYIGGMVSDLFVKGNVNPIMYIMGEKSN
jgi:uncharacterized protein